MTPKYDFVPAAKARRCISETIQPLVSGFEKVGDLTWARPLSDEIRAVVKVQGLKGAQYDITYGICCSWVPSPRGSGSAHRWVRTVKQTVPHLWVDHFTLNAEPRQWIPTTEGEATLRRQARKAVRQVNERAPIWWDAVSDAEGVLTEARRQSAVRFDIHHPKARLVMAFTLAHLGEVQAAQDELRAVADLDELPALQAMLAQASAGH